MKKNNIDSKNEYNDLCEFVFYPHINILSNIYKDAYFKTDVDYIKCESYKKANNSYICKDLLVVVDGKEIEINLKNIYFKCEGT